MQRKIAVLLIFLICSSQVIAQQEANAPQFMLFLGRFHPVLLHLPIGALLVTFFLDLVGRYKKNYQKGVITIALGFTAFFSIITAVLGYCLSLEGGYGEAVLKRHQNGGILMVILMMLLFLSSKNIKNWLSKLYYPIFALVLLTTAVTGHYGSILTHGDDFLTAYIPTTEDQNYAYVTEVDSLQYFAHVITPILEEKCTKCHNNNKKKGDLNLTSIAHILEGGKHGKIIESGAAEKSNMYKLLVLPIAEEEHMPPSGKPQLSGDEIWLIKHWINKGADFNRQIVDYPRNDSLYNLLPRYLILPEVQIREASSKDIELVKANGFTISKVVFDKPYLKVSYSEKKTPISKKALIALRKIEDQLIELNLQESGISDEMCSLLKPLGALKRLRLDGNDISGKSLKYLRGMENLELLNLFNAPITKSDLDELLSHISPRTVIVGIEGGTGKELIGNYGKTEVVSGIQSGFIEKTKLASPRITGEQSIFKNEIQVELKAQLKNERIYYTTDGMSPDSTAIPYVGPIVLKDNTNLSAISYKEGWYPSDVVSKNYNKIRHIITNIAVKYPPKEQYPGIHKLIDLERGTTNFRDGKWNGYQDDLIATLDMGEEISLGKIAINCLEDIGSYIFFPTSIEVYAGATESAMKLQKQLRLPPTDRERGIKLNNFEIDLEPMRARFVRIILKNIGKLPEWHEGAGDDAWIFVDEIMIL